MPGRKVCLVAPVVLVALALVAVSAAIPPSPSGNGYRITGVAPGTGDMGPINQFGSNMGTMSIFAGPPPQPNQYTLFYDTGFQEYMVYDAGGVFAGEVVPPPAGVGPPYVCDCYDQNLNYVGTSTWTPIP